MKRTIQVISALLFFLWITPAFALDASEATMQAFGVKVKTDKKTLVAKNLKLTYNEDKAFWPIYESYQKDLNKINERFGNVIDDYARQYIGKSLTDKKAEKLIKNYLDIENDLLKLKKSTFKKLGRILPGKKVATYIQMENKIQAVIRYECAVLIPLAE